MRDYFAGFGMFAYENAAMAFILATVYSIAPEFNSFVAWAQAWLLFFVASFAIITIARMIKLHIEQ